MDDDALYRSGGRTAHPAGLTVDELNATGPATADVEDDGQLGQGNTNHVGDDETPASVGPIDLGGPVKQVDAGAILLRSRDESGARRSDELEIIAQRSDGAHAYHRVSPFLASTVMRDGWAM